MARLQQESKENEARLRDVIAMKGQEASQSILSSRVQVSTRSLPLLLLPLQVLFYFLVFNLCMYMGGVFMPLIYAPPPPQVRDLYWY